MTFCVAGGVFHQYDSMAYPHVVTKQSRVRRVYNFVTRTDSTPVDKVDLPDQNSMQSEALKMYLEEFKKRLCDFNILNAQIATTEIMNIFQSLLSVQHCVNNWTWEMEIYNSAKLSKVG